MLTITLMMRLLFYGMHYLLTDIKMYSEYLLLQEHNEIYFSIPYKTDWLTRYQDTVSEQGDMSICSADCCVSELAP
jgi:hypothetical protein